MTRTFTERRPHGARHLLLVVGLLVLAGAWFQAAPAGACTPPEAFPQCTTTTTEPPTTTTSTVPEETTSTTVPPETTTTVAETTSTIPPGPTSTIPPVPSGPGDDELPRTGAGTWGLFILATAMLLVAWGCFKVRDRLERRQVNQRLRDLR